MAMDTFCESVMEEINKVFDAEKAKYMAKYMLERLKLEEEKRRPNLASECVEVGEGERWRRQIMREIAWKVDDIQDERLGEQRLLELNDEINKLIREKVEWERRIVELGGPKYYSGEEGNITRYFGAAKKLLEPPPPRGGR